MLTSSVGANYWGTQQNSWVPRSSLWWDENGRFSVRNSFLDACFDPNEFQFCPAAPSPTGGACELRWTARSEGTRKKWQGGRLEEFPLRRTIFLKPFVLLFSKLCNQYSEWKPWLPPQLFDFACAPCRCCYRLEGTKEDIFVNTKNIIEHVTSP